MSLSGSSKSWPELSEDFSLIFGGQHRDDPERSFGSAFPAIISKGAIPPAQMFSMIFPTWPSLFSPRQ
jgi:hypothetical protein